MKIPSLTSLIKKQKFDWVNSSIRDTIFPVPEKLRGDYKLFNFNGYISSENAIKEIEKSGYSPANIYELLYWTEWNNQDWVIALDSVGRVDDRRYVPFLFGSASERGLRLAWWGGGWDAICRFLGVRNSEISHSESQTIELGTLDSLTLDPLIKQDWIQSLEDCITNNTELIIKAQKEIDRATKRLVIVKEL